MKLSDKLIRNYKLYLDGEKKSREEFKKIFKKYFINPCLFKLMKRFKVGVKEKFIIEDFIKVRLATDYFSEIFPEFKKGWFTAYALDKFKDVPDLMYFFKMAGYELSDKT